MRGCRWISLPDMPSDVARMRLLSVLATVNLLTTPESFTPLLSLSHTFSMRGKALHPALLNKHIMQIQ